MGALIRVILGVFLISSLAAAAEQTPANLTNVLLLLRENAMPESCKLNTLQFLKKAPEPVIHSFALNNARWKFQEIDFIWEPRFESKLQEIAGQEPLSVIEAETYEMTWAASDPERRLDPIAFRIKFSATANIAQKKIISLNVIREKQIFSFISLPIYEEVDSISCQ
jgi:glutathionylspermidine synthase